MKRFFQSFYGKLSMLFLVLLLLLGTAQIWLTLKTTETFQAEADQQLNLSLANNLLPDFEPFLTDSIDFKGIKNMFHYMMVVNPYIEIYLVDNSGKVLAFFAEPSKKLKRHEIDLKPVREFLNEDYDGPLYGTDPRDDIREKPFSVAPLQIGENNGFLYVIIGGEEYDTAVDAARADYVKEAIIRGLLFTLLGAGIIGLVLFFFMTRRLRHVAEVVTDFEQGNFSRRVDTGGNDEFGDLAESFNTMADTLVANMDELKKTDELRRELVANISHDLRSPLASIKGYLETILMKEDRIKPEERNKYINIILNTTNNLERLVEQLFELSKLDARQTEPHFEPFSLSDLVQDIVMKFQPAAEKKSIHLLARVPEKLPQVEGDIGLIERVLSNLIENAIRYTPDEGKVAICIEHEGEELSVKVSDTGCGIAQEDLPHIFDRFYRVEKSRARATGGTGLGLAIAKKILDIHQSNIKVDSTIDVGTDFSFALGVAPTKNAREETFSVN